MSSRAATQRAGLRPSIAYNSGPESSPEGTSALHIFLETERLILRRFTADDVDLLVELDSDPEVMRYITGGRSTPRAEIENDILPAFLAYYARDDDYGFWAAVEKESGAFIGWFHFRPARGADDLNAPELGYRLRRSAWGKGYATEGSRALIAKGFREMGARRVTAIAYEYNHASRRVLEKCGLSLVRKFRFTPEELAADGVDPNVVWEGWDLDFALDREDWERMQGDGA